MTNQTTNTRETLLSVELGTDRGYVEKRATDEVCAMLNEWAPAQITRETFNQKAVKRVVELAAWAASPTAEAVSKSTGLRASVALCVIAALAKEGAQVRFADAKHALHAGTGGEDAKNIPGVSRAKLVKFLGTVEAGSVSSMVSRTLGKRGFLTALGLVGRADVSTVSFTGAHDAPIVRAVAQAVSKMTDGQLDALQTK